MERSEQERSAEATGVRSVRRALDILGLLSEDRPTVTLREIVDATGLAKTTAVRLVQTLEQCGLLWDTPAGYTAGPGLWRWAHLAHTSWELPRETRKLMRELAEEQRETVNLFMLRGEHRVCVAQQESPQALRHVVGVGDELPLWAGASSKILLGTAPDSLLHRIAQGSPYGELHARQLRVWADTAAEHGFAVSRGERDEGLTAVAVPVLGRSGAVVAALSLSGPSHRFPEETVQRFAGALQEVARRMSDQGFAHPLSPTM
ncbi:IclR family transcriptional regulator [Streptomyces sp. NBC_01465]|uniref:IclR family transcriptional regulator n=1 Tax=Streptomyces sp. NBC_01465 TaxID=2903878 RepID=UPI002E3047C1|nr:IclR family transcriptional regulator [Streptomyces sp. NBC_01465]